MGILEALKAGRLFFDGGMGSMLQEAGLPEGRLPDVWNVENPSAVEAIHLAYLEAGANFVTTNTFGAMEDKLAPYGYSVQEVMAAAVNNARSAIEKSGKPAFVAADMGPTGKLLKPYGDLDFEEAVSRFASVARAAEACGADCILIETMSDLYEMKAAVLAAKEHASLPIFATLIFDGTGKLLTGGSPAGAVAMLEGLGVTALGVNCGLGPVQLAPVIETLFQYTSIPLICQPNAGLPQTLEGKTVYNVSPEEFAAQMAKIASKTQIMGGCCGTTPAHIAAMTALCRALPLEEVTQKETLLISSYCQTVEFGKGPVVIGERINPTGKKKLQQALRENDKAYVLREALSQEEAGAHILDVNVGLPGLDEPGVLTETVEAIQSVTGLPLQLDTSDPVAMEQALRRYNGKPLINSVNGKQESLDEILPLVQKYGGGLVCLTLDETGIPETAEGRIKIARRMIEAAEAHGIKRRELLVDALTLPVSAGECNGQVTLETVRRLKTELGVKTALGVSNVSFGLPRRDLINTTFFTLALEAGLDGAIINPNSQEMMGAYGAFKAICGFDPQSQDYIERFREQSSKPSETKASKDAQLSLEDAVRKGLHEEAVREAMREVERGHSMIEIINTSLVPALDAVGRGFEEGSLFLPQLLMSAEAAKAAFQVLKEKFPVEENGQAGLILLATVKGDIHDIGKNIVKVLLESYRFRVLDLGKDVAPEQIVNAVREHDIRLVGLSALMTTTAPYMAETIRQLREAGLAAQVIVGGAVITQEYADQIGADCYAKDAMESVHFAQQIFVE
jgi:5-methyltetrahydrofolate--homocysteine methyltransferase